MLTMARVPIQTAFGRRPVLIASTLICLTSNIWRALAQDYASFMGACILNGIGAGPAEVHFPGFLCGITLTAVDCSTTNNCGRYVLA